MASDKVVKNQIKALSIRGMTDGDIAKKFGMEVYQIRNMRYQDKVWMAALQRGKFARKKNGKMTQRDARVIARSIHANLDKLAQDNDVLIANFAHGEISKAIKRKGGLPIKNWTDLSTADKIVRRATGRDKPGLQINMANFWGDVPSADEAQVIDVD